MIVELFIMAAVLMTATGCLQLDLAVKMHNKDGGATVTERLRFSKALLDLDHGSGLTRHISRAGAQSRMKNMGKGVTLKSHVEDRLPDGSRESVAVYRIPHIEDLRLPNPFLQNSRPGPACKINIRPTYSSNRRWQIGTLTIGMSRVGADKDSDFESSEASPAETPLDLQLYRDLSPIIANMMKDFEVKMTLTVPDQPGGRGRQSGDQTITLLHFNDKHMDRYAEPFLQNEEAMLAMLQFKNRDDDILEHTKNFPRNRQVPVYRGRRAPYHSDGFRIHPTDYLFQKYFAGRPKSEGGDK